MKIFLAAAKASIAASTSEGLTRERASSISLMMYDRDSCMFTASSWWR